jgi:hypothetical protein
MSTTTASAPPRGAWGTAAFTASASSPNVRPATPPDATTEGVSRRTTPTKPMLAPPTFFRTVAGRIVFPVRSNTFAAR